jgi:hypothetical protein
MLTMPDAYVLGVLLSACAAHDNVEVGELVLDESGVHVHLCPTCTPGCSRCARPLRRGR